MSAASALGKIVGGGLGVQTVPRNGPVLPDRPEVQISTADPGKATAASNAAAAAAAMSSASAQQPAAAANVPSVLPFLTPEQQQALDTAMTTNNSDVIALQQSYGQDLAKTTAAAGTLVGGTWDPTTQSYVGGTLDNTGALYQKGLQTAATHNDSEIARGLYSSSIRDGDLSDVAATTATNRMNMITSLGIINASDAQKVANLNSASASAQNTANNEAIANAQGQEATMTLPPSTTPAVTIPSPTASSVPTSALTSPVASAGSSAGSALNSSNASAAAAAAGRNAGDSLGSGFGAASGVGASVGSGVSK